MAKASVTISPRRRNAILKILSTNRDSLQKKCSNGDYFSFSNPFNLLIGLAFTAILAEGSDVDHCKRALIIFIKYRHAIQNPDKLDLIIAPIRRILESSLSAFKILGYPYYFDDFIVIYHDILHLDNVPCEIKKEMQRMLSVMF